MPRQLTCFSSLKATDCVVIFPIVDPSQSDDVAKYQVLKREAVCQYDGADSPQLIFFPFYVDKELETTGLVIVYLPPDSKMEVVIVGPLSVSLANHMERLFSRLFQGNLKLSVNLDACRADVNLASPSMEQLVVHLLAQFRALGPSDKFPPVLDSILAMSRIFATQVKQLIGDRNKLLADKKTLAATTEERSEQADRLQTQVDSLTTALTALTQQLSQQQSILSAEQDRTRQAEEKLEEAAAKLAESERRVRKLENEVAERKAASESPDTLYQELTREREKVTHMHQLTETLKQQVGSQLEQNIQLQQSLNGLKQEVEKLQKALREEKRRSLDLEDLQFPQSGRGTFSSLRKVQHSLLRCRTPGSVQATPGRLQALHQTLDEELRASVTPNAMLPIRLTFVGEEREDDAFDEEDERCKTPPPSAAIHPNMQSDQLLELLNAIIALSSVIQNMIVFTNQDLVNERVAEIVKRINQQVIDAKGVLNSRIKAGQKVQQADIDTLTCLFDEASRFASQVEMTVAEYPNIYYFLEAIRLIKYCFDEYIASPDSKKDEQQYANALAQSCKILRELAGYLTYFSRIFSLVLSEPRIVMVTHLVALLNSKWPQSEASLQFKADIGIADEGQVKVMQISPLAMQALQENLPTGVVNAALVSCRLAAEQMPDIDGVMDKHTEAKAHLENNIRNLTALARILQCTKTKSVLLSTQTALQLCLNIDDTPRRRLLLKIKELKRKYRTYEEDTVQPLRGEVALWRERLQDLRSQLALLPSQQPETGGANEEIAEDVLMTTGGFSLQQNILKTSEKLISTEKKLEESEACLVTKVAEIRETEAQARKMQVSYVTLGTHPLSDFLQALAVLENEQAKMVGASVDAKLGASGADDNVAELNAFQDHASKTKYVMTPADVIKCQTFMTEFIENGRALRKALNHFSSRLQFRYEPVGVRLSALPCVQFSHGGGGEARGGGAPAALKPV